MIWSADGDEGVAVLDPQAVTRAMTHIFAASKRVLRGFGPSIEGTVIVGSAAGTMVWLPCGGSIRRSS